MRNYKSEAKWSKEKYSRIEVKLKEKEVVEQFKKTLKEKGITVTEFFEKAIKNFIEKAWHTSVSML